MNNSSTQKAFAENKILGISGSPRKSGNSDTLLKQVMKGCSESETSTRTVFLRDIQYSSCTGCEKCRKDKLCTGLDDGLTPLYPDILSSKGLVLVSPSHNYNVTAWMKAFIDRLYCFYEFEESRPRGWSSRLAGQNRKAVIIGICEQEKEEDMGFTLEAMIRPLKALGFDIVDVIGVYGVFDRGKVKENPELLNKLYLTGKELARKIREKEV